MTISITSANAKLTLTFRNIAGAIIVGPFTVEGYAQDAAFGVEAVDSNEAILGVDGRMAVGRLPYLTKITPSLMANSPSVAFFNAVNAAEKALGDTLICDGYVAAPSLGQAWALTTGAMTRFTPIPTARKTFSEALAYELTFQDQTPAPITV